MANYLQMRSIRRDGETKGGREGVDRLTVNSLWSLYRINSVRLDRQWFCIKIWQISPWRPLGHHWDYRVGHGHGLGHLHYSEGCEGISPHSAWAKPEKTWLQTEHVLSKEHVLWHNCKNLTEHHPDCCEEKNKSSLEKRRKWNGSGSLLMSFDML